MADRTLIVQYIARGAGQVGRQATKVASSHIRATRTMAAANNAMMQRSRSLATASLFVGKAILFGIGAAMAVSAKAAIDFESAMAGVAKTLDFELHDEQYQRVADALREMALVTPVSVLELAKIAEIGGQLGIPIENIEEFTEVMAALGVSTDLTSEQAATGLARFANVMGTSFRDFDRLGSIIVDLGNNFATTESQILTFATRLAPIGATIGATEEEIFGLATAFSQLGVPAERGATAIQRTFLQIETATELGGQRLRDFADVAGKSLDEFTSASAVERFLFFIEGLGRIEEEGGSAILTLKELKINQQRTISTLLAATAAQDQFFRAISTANEAGDENVALFEEAAKRYGTTASQLKLLSNSFTDLRIELGTGVLPFLQGAINFFRNLFIALGENSEMVKTFIKILGGLAIIKIVFGAALLAVGKLVSGLAGLLIAGRAAGALGALVGVFKVLNVVTKIAQVGLPLVGAAFAILAIRWMQAAEAARQLKDDIEGITDALEAGDSPRKVWFDFLKNLDSFDEIKFRKALSAVGLNFNTFLDQLAEGGPRAARALGEVEDAFVSQREASEQILFPSPGVEFDPFSEEDQQLLRDTRTEYDLIGDAQKTLIDVEKRLFGVQDLQTTRSLDQTKALVEQGIAIDGWILKWQEAEKGIEGVTTTAEERFHKLIAGPGEAGEKFDDFVVDLQDGLVDLVDAYNDAFGEIKDILMSGIDPWEEYTGAVETEWETMFASLQAQAADSLRFAKIFEPIRSQLLPDTVAFFEGLSPGEKADLANIYKFDPERFATIMAGFDEGFDIFETGAQGIARQRNLLGDMIDVWVQDAVEGAKALEEFGFEAPEAWKQAVLSVLDDPNLPAELREPVRLALEDFARRSSAQAFGIGAQTKADWLAGFLSDQHVLKGAIFDWGTTVIRWVSESVGALSPSKEFMKIGRDSAEGYMIGLDQGLSGLSGFDGLDFFNFPNLPTGGGTLPQTMTGSSSVVSSSRQVVLHIDRVVNQGDLRSEITAGLIQAGIHEEIELR